MTWITEPGKIWFAEIQLPENPSYTGNKSLSTNKLILIAPCAILSSRKNNGGKHGNDKAENMGNNG